MDSLCINVVENDSVKILRLADFLDNGFVPKVSDNPRVLSCSKNNELSADDVAIWNWSRGDDAKESNASSVICEIFRFFEAGDDEKTALEKMRQQLNEGFIPDHPVDPRRKLFLIFRKDGLSGAVIDTNEYTYENSVIKLKTKKDSVIYSRLYKITSESDVVSNNEPLLKKRREFCSVKKLVLLQDCILLSKAADAAVVFLNNYVKKAGRHNKNPVTVSQLVEQLLDSRPVRNNPDINLRSIFDEEGVTKELEKRLDDANEELEIVNAFLKANPSFVSDCEKQIHEKTIKKNRKEYERLNGDIKKLSESRDSIEKEKTSLQQKLDAIHDEYDELERKKTILSEEIETNRQKLNTIFDEYDSKKSVCEQQYIDFENSAKVKKDTITEEISVLEDRKQQLSNECEIYQKTFGNTALNQSILPLLIEKITESQKKVLEQLYQHSATLSKKDDGVTGVAKFETYTYISPGESYNSVKKCKIDEYDEILQQNLIDCGLSKKSSLDLGIVIKSLILSSRNAIIVCNDPFDCVSNCISASLVGKTCAHLTILKDDPSAVLDSIQKIDDEVISIDGALESLNYRTYYTIVRNVKKILIFNCNDVRVLQAAPKEIWNYSILVDLFSEPRVKNKPAHPHKTNIPAIPQPNTDNIAQVREFFESNEISDEVIINSLMNFMIVLKEEDTKLDNIYLDRFIDFLKPNDWMENDE